MVNSSWGESECLGWLCSVGSSVRLSTSRKNYSGSAPGSCLGSKASMSSFINDGGRVPVLLIEQEGED